jgi:cytochrome c-type biogenesis protein CcmH/NrfF
MAHVRRSSNAPTSAWRAPERLARVFAALLVGCLLACAAVSFTSLARAELSDAEVERQAESLSRSIMSPFCPGRTVSACPSPNAHAWRDDIRKWVREGVSADEIRSRLAAREPEHNLLGAPPNRLGWALPIGLGLLSLAVLVLALRYLMRARPAPAPKKGDAQKESVPPPGEDREDWDAKLKQELDALEQ